MYCILKKNLDLSGPELALRNKAPPPLSLNKQINKKTTLPHFWISVWTPLLFSFQMFQMYQLSFFWHAPATKATLHQREHWKKLSIILKIFDTFCLFSASFCYFKLLYNVIYRLYIRIYVLAKTILKYVK